MERVLLFLLFFFSVAAHANVEIKTEYLEDPERVFSPQSITAPGLPWKNMDPETENFGVTKSRIWVKLSLAEDPQIYRAQTLFLKISNIYLRRVEHFSILGNTVLDYNLTGLEVPVSDREADFLLAGALTLRMGLPRAAGAQHFLSIDSDYPMALPMTMETGQELVKSQRKSQLLIGLFFGALLLAFVFNGFLAISLSSRIYFCYFLYIGSAILLYLGHEGLSPYVLWPEATWWIMREVHVTGCLSLFLYSQFARTFLQSSKQTPILDRILVWLVAATLVRAVWALFGVNEVVFHITNATTVLATLLVLLMAAISVKRGERPAKIFLLSTVVFNVGVVLFILQAIGLVKVGLWVHYAPHLGTLLEIILLSLALADRIRITTQDLRASNLKLERQSAEMAHSEKMSALGRMAGGIAHEINNPLAIIKGNATILKKMFQSQSPDPQAVGDIVATIENTSERISKIMRAMRMIARNSQSDPMENCSLRTILDDTYELCRDRFEQAKVKLEFPRLRLDIPLLCRSSEICQVLMNLLNNSFDATSETTDRWVRVEIEENPEQVLISVTDSGKGIPVETRDRIQEPFFTTKEVGKGIGLGLSISRTIVSNHHGALWLDSASPHTRFVFSLPRA